MLVRITKEEAFGLLTSESIDKARMVFYKAGRSYQEAYTSTWCFNSNLSENRFGETEFYKEVDIEIEQSPVSGED